jgi:hypothetical protein
MTDRGERRRLIVTGCRPVKSGRGENGREWTLYQVAACTLAGREIQARLVSFEELPAGEVEVLVTRRDDEHGASYTLKRPKPSVTALAGRVDQLERDLRSLAARVQRLEERPGA